MDVDSLVHAATQGMLLCLTVSLPFVIAAAAVGLAVSFVQAITSLQDQALPFAVKLIAVTIVLVIAAPLSCAAILHFANEMMRTAFPN
ncbi:aldolase [Burkholderia contaminans FFH2055]|jgi:type III secretion protein S|uniref:EscS/YscS/HrcS family type III secretion system export apparatus protein n=2 Tax=Burkholderia cepacia complex TaxID=87882 RepID=A0A0G3YPG7_9BURK|nr:MULTISPECIES: type III secretion system export apparatus subunit SctS [Burkholderia]AKM39273.1 aldolase [Burkholderia contaminans]AOL06889.1 aldolase [Burkholderia contaminans]ELK6462636.1 type III secretion system export apparatus subunit SctS [Burkholderia contaminans]KAG8154516.1 EscS/YscS/HrcS family type III secretion system export apparatus protein [Burkholderia catarinensis]KKL33579.1 aldolase [Burkholderia contaminans FFH2055]